MSAVALAEKDEEIAMLRAQLFESDMLNHDLMHTTNGAAIDARYVSNKIRSGKTYKADKAYGGRADRRANSPLRKRTAQYEGAGDPGYHPEAERLLEMNTRELKEYALDNDCSTGDVERATNDKGEVIQI